VARLDRPRDTQHHLGNDHRFHRHRLTAAGQRLPLGRVRHRDDYLFGQWTVAKVLATLLIPATFTALALAFWRRSWAWGLAVINGAVLFKIGWSYVVSGTAGANAHLVPALAGLLLVDGLLLVAARVLAHRRSQGSPA
jgi:hypothetical protein